MQGNRRHFLGAAAALLTAGLSACGGGGDDSGSSPAQTTLMVYLLGSDLESKYGAATANLKEMLEATVPRSVRVLITTGAALKDDPGGLVTSWKTVKRFELADGRLTDLADVGQQNMSAGGTLADFLTWGARHAPADRYMAVLWDHGGGQYGFGQDELFPDDSLMSMRSMADALAQFKRTVGVPLDYLGLSACLMATVEVASVLQPFVRYLGASQESEPESGQDWTSNLQELAAQPDMPAAAFGAHVADAYLSKQQRPQDDEDDDPTVIPTLEAYATASVIDMAQLPSLMTQLGHWAAEVDASYDVAGLEKSAAFDRVATWGNAPRRFRAPVLARPGGRSRRQTAGRDHPVAETAAVPPAALHWMTVATARTRATSFGDEAIKAGPRSFDLVDLRHFAALLATEGIGQTTYPALVQALEQAVAHNVVGTRVPQACGLSVYFPNHELRSALGQSFYADLGMPTAYVQLLERHTAHARGITSMIHIEPLWALPQRPTVIEAQITSLYGLASANLMLTEGGDSAPVVKVLGTMPHLAPSGSAGDGHGVLQYELREWLCLEGQPLLLTSFKPEAAEDRESDEDGEDEPETPAWLCGAPVRLTRADGTPPELVTLLIRIGIENAEGGADGDVVGRIQGMQSIDFDNPDALPDRVDGDLDVGDVIEPIHLQWDARTHDWLATGQPAFGMPVTVTADTALRESPLAAGNHSFSLVVTDLARKRSVSAPLRYVMA